MKAGLYFWQLSKGRIVITLIYMIISTASLCHFLLRNTTYEEWHESFTDLQGRQPLKVTRKLKPQAMWRWHFKFLCLCELHVGVAVSVYAVNCRTEIFLHSLILAKDCTYNLKMMTGTIRQNELTSEYFSNQQERKWIETSINT